MILDQKDIARIENETVVKFEMNAPGVLTMHSNSLEIFKYEQEMAIPILKTGICFCLEHLNLTGGVLPYMGYIGMCGPKGYGFSAVLVINRVSILADFGHFGHK